VSFTASVPTVFGTTKGANGKNATFNAQAGDTLYLFYTDYTAANGGPGAALVTKTAVLGGYAAQLKGSHRCAGVLQFSIRVSDWI